jgi:nitrous oxidase accessory protein NosD
MGVWMEAESTVMTVSQGISRPNGANTALNFLTGATPAVLSANRLMGESVGTWLAGTNGSGDGFIEAGDEDDGFEDDDGKFAGPDLSAGG